MLCKALQNEAADFKSEDFALQLTHDRVVTLQLNSVQSETGAPRNCVVLARPVSSEAGSALQHISLYL